MIENSVTLPRSSTTSSRSPSVIITEAPADDDDFTVDDVSSSTAETSEEYRYLSKYFSMDPNFQKILSNNPSIASDLQCCSCSLERDTTLWHGRLLYSKSHLFFYGTSFTKALKLILDFKDILSVEKKNTVGLFPSAIRISTLHSRHLFAGFMRRDFTYAKVLQIWESCLANDLPKFTIKDSSNESLDETTKKAIISPSSTENLNLEMFKSSMPASSNVVDSKSAFNKKLKLDIIMHEDRHGPPSSSLLSADEFNSNDISKVSTFPRLISKTSSGLMNPSLTTKSSFRKKAESRPQSATPMRAFNVWNLPDAPVKVEDQPLKHLTCDVLIEGIDCKQLFHLIFEQEGSLFMKKFYTDRGSSGFEYKPWVDNSRYFSYTVSFKAPLLPASTTSCLETQDLIRNEDTVYIVECRTKTPNVPYGDSFEVLSRYCISYESLKSVRLVVSMRVEFKQKILWESQVEKGAVNGVQGHVTDLLKAIKNNIESLGKGLPSLGNYSGNSDQPPVILEPESSKSNQQQSTAKEPFYTRIQYVISSVTETLKKFIINEQTLWFIISPLVTIFFLYCFYHYLLSNFKISAVLQTYELNSTVELEALINSYKKITFNASDLVITANEFQKNLEFTKKCILAMKQILLE